MLARSLAAVVGAMRWKQTRPLAYPVFLINRNRHYTTFHIKTAPYRLVFFGTDAFSIAHLDAILAHSTSFSYLFPLNTLFSPFIENELVKDVCVVTVPDRLQGRHRVLTSRKSNISPFALKIICSCRLF